MSKTELIESLKSKGILKSEAVEKALTEIDRADFVLPEHKGAPYIDRALPIGYGQTISQPFTVVFMLENLNVKPSNIIMDIGTGSGWQAALLAHLTGQEGHVHTIDIVSQMSALAKENIDKYPLIKGNITFYTKNATEGLLDVSKNISGFDRIVASAELKTEPVAWRQQLKVGGTLLYPKDGGIYKIKRNTQEDFDTLFYPGFIFVPFIDY